MGGSFLPYLVSWCIFVRWGRDLLLRYSPAELLCKTCPKGCVCRGFRMAIVVTAGRALSFPPGLDLFQASALGSWGSLRRERGFVEGSPVLASPQTALLLLGVAWEGTSVQLGKCLLRGNPRTDLDSLPSCRQKQQAWALHPCVFLALISLQVLKGKAGFAVCPQVPVWLAGPVL